MPPTLEHAIAHSSDEGYITLIQAQTLASQHGCTLRDIEHQALKMGIIPLRYRRNQSTISPDGQLQLSQTHILIIGTGGLGGHIAEMLCRIGIGRLTLYDRDHFEEHNLNRQNFCTLKTLGLPKATVVREALLQIDPAIEIEAHHQQFDPQRDLDAILAADLIIDAVDDPVTKQALAERSLAHGKDFVHGAIGGLAGQVSSSSPLHALYRHSEAEGAEHLLGNPCYNVTLTAALQVSEAIKLILKIGEPLKGHCLVTDLLYNDFEILPL